MNNKLSSLRKGITKLILAFTLLVAMATAGVIGEKILWPLTKDYLFNKPSSINLSNWQVYEPGQMQLAVALPGEPNPIEIQMPEETNQLIQEYRVYQYESGSQLLIMIGYALYKIGVNVNLDGATSGAVTNVMNLEDISDFNYVVHPVRIDAVDGNLVTGTYEQNDMNFGLKVAILVKGSRAWIIQSIYLLSDKNAEMAAQKVIDSIRIKHL